MPRIPEENDPIGGFDPWYDDYYDWLPRHRWPKHVRLPRFRLPNYLTPYPGRERHAVKRTSRSAIKRDLIRQPRPRRGARKPRGVGGRWKDPREQLEERAEQGIRGSLEERVVYKALVERGLLPGIDFDFQSIEFGGRAEVGGIVMDFYFPVPRICIQVQSYWHTTSAEIFERDRHQQLQLFDMGITVLELWPLTIHNEISLEMWMDRNLMHLWGTSPGSISMAGSGTGSEIGTGVGGEQNNMVAQIDQLRQEFRQDQDVQDIKATEIEQAVNRIESAIYSGYGPQVIISSANIANILRSTNFETGVAGWQIEKSGDIEINNLTARGTLQSNNFSSGVSGWRINQAGDAEFNNVVIRGRLESVVFVKEEINAVSGDLLVANNSTVLTAPHTVTTGTNVITVDTPGEVSTTNRIRLKVGGNDTWFTVTSTTATAIICEYANGSTGWTAPEGTAIVNYGGLSGSVLVSGGVDPLVSIRSHGASPWSDEVERVRLGDMEGWGPVVSQEFGIGLGDYGGNNYLYWTPTAGLVSRGNFDLENGVIQGVLNIATAGGIYQGTGTFGSPTTGLKLFNSGGVGKLSTFNTGVEQVTLDTDGNLKAGAGDVWVNSTGVSILNSTADQAARAVKWYTASTPTGNPIFDTIAWASGATGNVYQRANPQVTTSNFVIQSKETSSRMVEQRLHQSGSYSEWYIKLSSSLTGAPATILASESGGIDGALNLSLIKMTVNKSAAGPGPASLAVLNDGSQSGDGLFEDNLSVGQTTVDSSSPLVVAGTGTTGIRIKGATPSTEIADLFVGTQGPLILSTVAGSATSRFIDLRPADDNFGIIIRESDGAGTAAYLNVYVTAGSPNIAHFVVNNTQSAAQGLFIAGGGSVGVMGSPDHFFHVSVSGASQGAHLGNAYVGNWVNTSYAQHSHWTFRGSTGGYGMIQDGSVGDVFLSAPTGRSVWLRINNSTVMQVSTGNVAITGTTGTLLQSTGSVGGSRYWEGSTVGTTAQTIVPNGASDVTTACYIAHVTVSSAGGSNIAPFSLTTPGTKDITIGGSTWQYRVNADGSLDVRRTAGTDTANITLFVIYQ